MSSGGKCPVKNFIVLGSTGPEKRKSPGMIDDLKVLGS
jgi:hypothetical protein